MSNTIPIEFWNNALGWEKRAKAAEAKVAAVERALDDEEANLADDGARLSHSVVRRLRAALATEAQS